MKDEDDLDLFEPGPDLASLLAELDASWLAHYNPNLAPPLNLASRILDAGGSEELAQAALSIGEDMLTDRFPEALRLAVKLHEGRTWAATKIPTVAHSMSLAARLIHLGADEDLAIAALFHESVAISPEELGRIFGGRTGDLLPACRPIAALPHAHEQSWAAEDCLGIATIPKEAMLLHACDAVLLGREVLDDYRALLQDPAHPVDALRLPLQVTFQSLCQVFIGENIIQMAEEATIWSRYGTQPADWFKGIGHFQKALQGHGMIAESAGLTRLRRS